jgi:threonine dehydratase
VDEMVLVDNDAICAAIKDVFEDTRSILEPAGALAIAGAKAWSDRSKLAGRTLVAVTSGANMNFERLRFVAERAELGEQREAILAVTIPERPGSFRQFCTLLGPRSVTEFNYRYADARQAHVFVGVQVRDRNEIRALVARLRRHKLPTRDLSDNEMAKLHVRHLVGGRAPLVTNELLYRFEFPERPGALMNFLKKMNDDWNITLFHYRNHGADFGRVLIGMQVPARDKPAFRRFLNQLGYSSCEETRNPARTLFLC